MEVHSLLSAHMLARSRSVKYLSLSCSTVSCDSLGHTDVLDWLVREPPKCPADTGLGDQAQGLKHLTAGTVPELLPVLLQNLTYTSCFSNVTGGSMMVDFPFTLSILKTTVPI